MRRHLTFYLWNLKALITTDRNDVNFLQLVACNHFLVGRLSQNKQFVNVLWKAVQVMSNMFWN